MKKESTVTLAPKKKKRFSAFSISVPLLLMLILGVILFLNNGLALADNQEDTDITSVEEIDIPKETRDINVPTETRVLAEGTSGTGIEDLFLVYFVKPVLWTKENSVDIDVEVTNNGNDSVATMKAKVGDGNWIDISSNRKVSLTTNEVIYIEITTQNGMTITKSQNIEIFDREPPILSAKIDGNILLIESQDSQSGVSSVFVDGNEISYPKDGNIKIELDKLSSTIEKISLQAVDNVGNISDKYAFTNPNYQVSTPTTATANQNVVNYNNANSVSLNGGTGSYGGITNSNGGTGAYGSTTSSNGGTGSYSGTASSYGGTGSYSGTASSYGGTGSYSGTTSSYGGTGSYSGTASSYGGTGSYSGTTSSYGGTGSYDGTTSSYGSTGSYGGTTSSNGATDNTQGQASTIAGDTIMTTPNGTPPSKQFVTVVTKEGQTFYIIIDNEKEKNNVYFLTEVDLENLANAGSAQATVTSDSTDTAELIDGGEKTSSSILFGNESTDKENNSNGSMLNSNDEAENKKEKNNGFLTLSGYIVIAVILFIFLFIGYQRFVVMKRKHDEEDVQQDEDIDETDTEGNSANEENREEENPFFNQDEEVDVLEENEFDSNGTQQDGNYIEEDEEEDFGNTDDDYQ